MTLTRTLAYADVEALLTSWLQAQLGNTARVVTETPADFTKPVVKVERIGGGRRFTLDTPTVDVECFASTTDGTSARGPARQLSDQVGMLLEQVLPGTKGSGWSVGAVFCTSGPSWAPWDNTNVRRFVASYQMAVHASQ